MNSGDILIFHINIIHCANSNSSQSQWRRALATRWLGDDVVVNEDKPHILQKKEIKAFIEKMGKSWESKLDPSFFPDLS